MGIPPQPKRSGYPARILMNKPKLNPVRCLICGTEFKNQDLQTFVEVNKEENVNFHICKDCIAKLAIEARLGTDESEFTYFDEDIACEISDVRTTPVTHKTTSPAKIKQYLDQYIVGQENAKRIISVAYYNHLKRIGGDNRFGKSNILIIGATGSGKTLIAEKLAEVASVPLVIEDATRYTKAGYVGDDVDNMIRDLFVKSGHDKELTERGIVYIDECDKLAETSESNSLVSGRSLQNSLLKIIEGTTIPVMGTPIDTKNILFICGGAFVGLDKTVEENRRGKRSIGFSSEKPEYSDQYLTPDDFIQYGLTPEFVSRLPIIAKLTKLSETELVKVLTEPKNALCKEYENLFSEDGVHLTFTDDALQYIAKSAFQNNTGARGLRGVMENALLDTMYVLPERKVKEAVLDYDTGKNRIVVVEKKKKAKKEN